MNTLDRYFKNNTAKRERDNKDDKDEEGRITKKKTSKWILENEEAKVYYEKYFISKRNADRLFKDIRTQVDWKQEEIELAGKKFKPNRMTSSNGDKGLRYTYTGTTKEPQGWLPAIKEIKDMIEKETKVNYNFALLNLYKDGNSSISKHSDKEEGIVPGSSIASISLGIERDFILHRIKDGSTTTVCLGHGDLLIMGGNCQKFYEHSVPVRKKIKQERINITFRCVKTT